MRTMPERYQPVGGALAGHDADDRETAASALIDALWDAFGSDQHPAPGAQRWSWVGVYYGPGFGPAGGEAAGADAMVLGHRRNKPACSPIGLHGMCGRALLRGVSIVVDDVASLGEDYIACDPRDVSELVVPLVGEDGAVWGVLDADSLSRAAFDEDDARAVEALARGLGLIAPGSAALEIVRY